MGSLSYREKNSYYLINSLQNMFSELYNSIEKKIKRQSKVRDVKRKLAHLHTHGTVYVIRKQCCDQPVLAQLQLADL